MVTYDYPRPAITVDCVVFLVKEDGVKLLLVERDRPPFRGQWAFPGGFVGMKETLQEAAERELQEETGLKNIELRQLHTFSEVDRDPRDRIITTVYIGEANEENCMLEAGDDASNAQWFPLENHPKLAFDHCDILRMAVESMGFNKGV